MSGACWGSRCSEGRERGEERPEKGREKWPFEQCWGAGGGLQRAEAGRQATGSWPWLTGCCPGCVGCSGPEILESCHRVRPCAVTVARERGGGPPCLEASWALLGARGPRTTCSAQTPRREGPAGEACLPVPAPSTPRPRGWPCSFCL